MSAAAPARPTSPPSGAPRARHRELPVLVRLALRALSYRRLMLSAVGSLVASGVLVLIGPRLVGIAIDTGLDISDDSGVSIARGTVTSVAIASAFLFVAAIARGASMYGQAYLGERISQMVAYDLRNEIYDRLQRLSFAYHDQSQIGDVMSRATQDVEGVRFFVSMGLLRSAYVLVLLFVAAALMLTTNLRLALVALAFVPVVVTQAIFVSLRLGPVWAHVQQLQGQLGTVLQENLSGQRVVKAFAREEHEQRKFDAVARELYDESYRTSRIQAFNEPALLSLWLISLAFVFWFGGREILEGRLTEGQLIEFLLYLTLLQVPVRSVGFIVMMSARARSAGERIFEIVDAQSPVQEHPDAVPLRVERGEVRFEGVAFRYDRLPPGVAPALEGAHGPEPDPGVGAAVLSGIDIVAQPGEVVALLGPTGSGKSSIVNLIPRFYDVTEGRLTIDGQDVRDVTLTSLREAIGIVQQDLFLFAATIRENIAYGRPHATDDEVREAARAARIHDFIEGLPDGYDTWVGERGATLSGGQRQRVAIARTLLLDPRILVLDDSTSSVDMRTEFEIQEALQELMRGRTTFVIAQRLRTVRQADQILVLQDGEIVQRGRHEELLAEGGFYREIYDLELRAQEESAIPAGAGNGAHGELSGNGGREVADLAGHGDGAGIEARPTDRERR
jgi:ABC-type multidrug transport system fused ATPase/permease subunit